MQLLDLTLDTAARNVALDEALLEEAEHARGPCERLRLWEPAQPLVVVGRASRVDAEVDRAACDADRVPIIRRPSGGAAIVAGPGCLMYSLVLSCELRPALRAIQHAHEFVLGTVAEALAPLVPGIRYLGTSDLALASEQKFSGNSLRCKRRCLLYHGTLLYDFRLELIAAYLTMPPRQPDYRRGRSHAEFVANLPVSRAAIRQALLEAWKPSGQLHDWPQAATVRLAAEKYAQAEWNLRL